MDGDDDDDDDDNKTNAEIMQFTWASLSIEFEERLMLSADGNCDKKLFTRSHNSGLTVVGVPAPPPFSVMRPFCGKTSLLCWLASTFPGCWEQMR